MSDIGALSPAYQGVYVAVVKAADREKLTTDQSVALVAAFTSADKVVDGTVTSEVTVPAAAILDNTDYKQAYKVVAWRAHGYPTADRLLAEADVSVTQNQYNALKGKPLTTGSFSIVEVSGHTIKVQVDLQNLYWPTASYVSVYETGTEDQLGHSNMGVATDWITPQRVTNGSATSTLTLSTTTPMAAGTVIDPNKSYSVMAWAGHTLPTADTIFFQSPLTITDAQWETVNFPFTDVDKSSVHYPGIQWVFDQEITTGTKPTLYSPKQSVNRAQMALFLYRLAGEPKVTLPATSPFPDVKSTDTSYKAINWMVQQKLTVGVKKDGETVFDKSGVVTRGQMAAFLYRYSGSPNYQAPAKSTIDDVPTTNVFYKEINWLAANKITTPYTTSAGDVVYRPKNDVQRDQMATFLYRLAADK